MSQDSFTEVTNESWFGRIGGAIKGVLFGLLLFLVSFPLLFWNEGRAVKRYKTLKEGGGAVVSVTAETVDTGNAEKLIHVSGRATTDETLTDPVFGVSANALKLDRSVMMYQWKEASESKTRKKLGGGTETVTTYHYSKDWSDMVISSASFRKPAGHQNPTSFPYESNELIAKNVTLGAFTLSDSLITKINASSQMTISDSSSLPAELQGKAKTHNGGYYIGDNPMAPHVGDLQVTFSIVQPTDVSIVAQQAESSFRAYSTKAGGSIELLQTGTHSAAEMIQKAQDSNKTLTWILRIVGFIVMLAALNMIFRPLSVLADVLPILGTIVGAGTGIVAFLMAAILSLTTIAIAWIFYRPLLGITLIAISAGLAFAAKSKLKQATVRT